MRSVFVDFTAKPGVAVNAKAVRIVVAVWIANVDAQVSGRLIWAWAFNPHIHSERVTEPGRIAQYVAVEVLAGVEPNWVFADKPSDD